MPRKLALMVMIGHEAAPRLGISWLRPEIESACARPVEEIGRRQFREVALSFNPDKPG
jgi:hypothetical protein